MSASTDNLVVNLSQIYQIKNQIKEVISTDSDVFADYPSYIQAAIQGGGTVSGYAYVTSNGDYDIASYAMVNVEVPVPPGYIVPAGTFEITDNDTYDVSSYAYVDVQVEGGGSGGGDPWYSGTVVVDMIYNEESTADYVHTDLADNFSVTMDGNEESVEAVEWNFYASVPTGELDQDNNPIMEEKTVHVIVSSNDEHGELPMATDIEAALEDYSDLYDNICPILENATLTASEDPSEDGYDYLLEGDIYTWNLNNNEANVMEITENGFYPNEGALGFNVNVTPSAGEGTYYYIYPLENSIPASILNISFDMDDIIQYEDLEIRLVRPVNYTDPSSGETHEPYIEWYFTENDAVCSNAATPFCQDTNGDFYQHIQLYSGASPDTLVGEYHEWVEVIDPETGEDNGMYEITATYSAPVTESLSDTDDNIWLLEDDHITPIWSIINNHELLEQLEPQEVVGE